MSFDTAAFWLFAVVVWAVYLIIRNNAARIGLLIAASVLYYASWNVWYLALLAGFTAISFWIGNTAYRGAHFPLMFAGVSICTAGLAAAKVWGHPLPVGVSFYALQAIAYIVDCYRGDLKERAGLLRYSLYMSFFPRLLAGPVVRPGDFLPQTILPETISRPRLTSADIWEGLVLIVFGLFKKLVIADNLALVVDPVFGNLHTSGARIVLATYAFALQIYCDFAGYTDMALGVARFFGYKLPENFNWPYLSKNPADFWRRWHISLSNWLRDYVYFSLPGHRSKSRIYSYIHFPITMLICGIWHGLGWTYTLWGLYHGILLAGYYKLRPKAKKNESQWTLGSIGSILLMQQLSVLGWILFRLNRISDLPVYFRQLTQSEFAATFTDAEWMAVTLMALALLAHLAEQVRPLAPIILRNRWHPWTMTVLLIALLATATWNVPAQQMFFYFRF
ncbi:MAG: MBOAT family O-acyltransferase [Bryobacteraceae bacterium]